LKSFTALGSSRWEFFGSFAEKWPGISSRFCSYSRQGRCCSPFDSGRRVLSKITKIPEANENHGRFWVVYQPAAFFRFIAQNADHLACPVGSGFFFRCFDEGVAEIVEKWFRFALAGDSCSRLL
jgi:hypothetical protein